MNIKYSASATEAETSSQLSSLYAHVNITKAVLFFLACSVCYRALRRASKGKLPPGPPALPVLGHVLHLNKKAWLKWTEWSKEYGPLFYLNLAGQPVIVLNSLKVAGDLFDRRGDIYSDRAPNIVGSQIMTGGYAIMFMSYGERLRRMRKAAHEVLNKSVASNYHPVQMREAVRLTSALLENTDGLRETFLKLSASTIMSVLYATPQLKSHTDPGVTKVQEFTNRFSRAVAPGAYLVEFLPWMRYLPSSITKWKREAEEGFIRDSEMFDGLCCDVKRRIAEGDHRPSLVGNLTSEPERYGLSDPEIAWLAAIMYVAGTESTADALTWFILAMIHYPEIQKKAQDELDSIVGRSRMPTFADYENLPYIRALVKEILRWKVIAPYGMPHYTAKEDWYDGYYIPKGTLCIPNIWAMNMDPNVYGADAGKFSPDRHLDPNGQLGTPLMDTKGESHAAYGFGRRVCVGKDLANYTLFIDMACILWAMNLKPVKDAKGNPVLPDIDDFVTDGFIIQAKPFEYIAEARFADAQTIIEQTADLCAI